MQTTKSKAKILQFSFIWILIFTIIIIKSFFLLMSLYSHEFFVIIFFYSIFTCMIILFFISFSFLFSNKKSFLYLLIFDLFVSLLFVADIIYYRAFGKLISVYMIFSKGVLIDMNQSIISLIKLSDFLFLFDIPILILYLKSSYNNILIKRKPFLFIVTLLSSILIITMQFKQLEDSKIIGNYRIHPLIMSPLGNHMFDIFRFFYEKGDNLDTTEINLINNWLDENAENNNPDTNFKYLKGIAEGKNIIAIQFESLENITINKSYYNQEITPNINKLLKSSIYFDNIYAQVKDGNSSDAELMFNTSIYPLNNGSTFLRFGENKYNSLPFLFNLNGYTSTAIHGDDKEFWNRDRVFPSLGFNEYIHEDEFDYKKMDGMGIADESLFLQSYKEIEDLKNPYYLFIITLTSHMPFDISKNIRFLDLPYDDYSCNYLQSIHYTDKAFGEFYNKLEENGYLDNAIVVIYGDHEGVHKYYDTYLPDNNGKIPFIIHIPGMNGFVMDKVGGQVDMMPTLLYLLGFKDNDYNKSVMGKNLFGNNPDSVLLPTGEIIGQMKNKDLLSSANNVADLIIRGNYFK